MPMIYVSNRCILDEIVKNPTELLLELTCLTLTPTVKSIRAQLDLLGEIYYSCYINPRETCSIQISHMPICTM